MVGETCSFDIPKCVRPDQRPVKGSGSWQANTEEISDQVEELFEREVVAYLPALLCGQQERAARGKDPVAAAVEDGVVPVGLLEQFDGDRPAT